MQELVNCVKQVSKEVNALRNDRDAYKKGKRRQTQQNNHQFLLILPLEFLSRLKLFLLGQGQSRGQSASSSRLGLSSAVTLTSSQLLSSDPTFMNINLQGVHIKGE